MSPHFQSYASNLNRVNMAELLDHYASTSRMSRLTPSLIVNPVTGLSIACSGSAKATAKALPV